MRRPCFKDYKPKTMRTYDYTATEASHSPSLIEVAVTIAELLPFEDPSFSFRRFISFILEEIDSGSSNEDALRQAAKRVLHDSFLKFEHAVEDREDAAIAALEELFATP